MAEIAKGEVKIEVDFTKFQADLRRAEAEFNAAMQRMQGKTLGGSGGLGSSPGTAAMSGPAMSQGISPGGGSGLSGLAGGLAGGLAARGFGSMSSSAIKETMDRARNTSTMNMAALSSSIRSMESAGTAAEIYVKQQMSARSGGSPGANSNLFTGPFEQLGRGLSNLPGAMVSGVRAVGSGIYRAGSMAFTPIPGTPRLPGGLLALGSMGAGISIMNAQQRSMGLEAQMGLINDSSQQSELADQIVEAQRSQMGGLVGTSADVADIAAGRKTSIVEIAERRQMRANAASSRARGLMVANLQQQTSNIGRRGLSGLIGGIESQFDAQIRGVDLSDNKNQGIVDQLRQQKQAQIEETTMLYQRDQSQQIGQVRTQIQQNDLYRKGAFQQAAELGINSRFNISIDNARFNGDNELANMFSKLRDSEIERSRLISPRNISQIDYFRTSTGGTNDTRSPNVDPPRASQINTLIEIMRNGFVTLTTMSGTGTISVPVAQ